MQKWPDQFVIWRNSKEKNMIQNKTRSNRITNYLAENRGWPFILYASLVAFIVYSCMYAFRKPFSVATFDGQYLWGLHLKIWLIASQILGYTLSKFLGIKFVSEMKAGGRALAIVLLACIAEIALFFFGLVPSPYNIVFLFFNGLPLGMIWGLVFSYLEGRRYTEMLGSGLSISFIFASGFVKSTGKWLMLDYGISEYWMPFVTGLIFLVPLGISVYLLNLLPSPSAEDESLRTKREPMNGAERMAFFKKFATVIVILVLAYALLNIYREIRDNYAAEIWAALGYGDDASVFTTAEIPVGIITLIIMSLVTFINSNIKALYSIIGLVIFGFAIIGLGAFLFQKGVISGYVWMISTGLGLYMGYIPFNALLFERMIAAFRYTSNIGFIIYVADSFGYLTSIISFSMKNFFSPEISWLNFFVQSSYYVAFIGISFMLIAVRWFYKKQPKEAKVQKEGGMPVQSAYSANSSF
jgi:MFS family permease